jgi:hypothetical protein
VELGLGRGASTLSRRGVGGALTRGDLGVQRWLQTTFTRGIGAEKTRQLTSFMNTVDALSLGGGTLIGRYAPARIALVCYTVLLHVWVFIVYTFG